MFMSTLKILIKNPVKKNFDITFMGNKEAIKIFFFSFPIKKFFN